MKKSKWKSSIKSWLKATGLVLGVVIVITALIILSVLFPITRVIGLSIVIILLITILRYTVFDK